MKIFLRKTSRTPDFKIPEDSVKTSIKPKTSKIIAAQKNTEKKFPSLCKNTAKNNRTERIFLFFYNRKLLVPKPRNCQHPKEKGKISSYKNFFPTSCEIIGNKISVKVLVNMYRCKENKFRQRIYLEINEIMSFSL